MKAGYKIDNQAISEYCRNILVSNYSSINEVVNLPCVENSSLLTNKSYNAVGVWKIKKLK